MHMQGRKLTFFPRNHLAPKYFKAGLEIEKNYNLPFSFFFCGRPYKFWPAIYFFGLPPTAIFAIAEIVLCLDFQWQSHLLADKKMKKYMK